MKIKVDEKSFLKSWSMVERCTGATSAGSIFSSVLLVAEHYDVELRATNIKTSIVCKTQGVDVLEPGSCALPVKGVSDLFNKAPGDGFELTITDGRAVMAAGKSRYKFATYPAKNFPKLPSSSDAKKFCSVRAGDLLLAIDRGSMCASPKVEHPEYLSSALLELTPSGLNIVSTDKRRLAVSRIDTDTAGEEASLLLPLSSLRDLQKIMHSLPDDTEVNITHDSGQAYFDTAADIEFAVREVSSKFPPYQRLLGGKTVGVIEVGKADLASAIERVDVVVRDSNKVVYVKRGKDSSELILFGQSPEFGEAIEHIPATFSGESIMGAFNTRFFMEALKAMDADVVSLSSGDSNGHMVINAINSDATKCMIAPTEASNDEINNLYESIIAQDPAV